MPKTPDLTKWTYEALASLFAESVAKNDKKFPEFYHQTCVWENAAGSLSIQHNDTVIATVHHDGSVALWDAGRGRGTWGSGRTNGRWTETTKRRLDWLLQANLNKRLVSIRKKLRVYDIASGSYADFREGMVVTK